MIVGIFGQKENGKSTLANLLLDVLNNNKVYKYQWTGIGFATAVKQTLSEVTGLPLVNLLDYKNSTVKPPGWDVTAREGMQKLGQCIRDIKPSAWIDKVINHPIRPQTLVVDDGRYLNEAKAIRDAGGFTILVIRPDKFDKTATHPSESEMVEIIEHCIQYKTISYGDFFNKVIYNEHGLTQLKTIAITLGGVIERYCQRREKELLK